MAGMDSIARTTLALDASTLADLRRKRGRFNYRFFGEGWLVGPCIGRRKIDLPLFRRSFNYAHGTGSTVPTNRLDRNRLAYDPICLQRRSKIKSRYHIANFQLS